MATKRKSRAATVQATHSISYELHSLGWKAFQDLCATIMREVMGQHIQQFFDSHDGGRDGAFNGIWKPRKGTTYSGQFTVQCKFSAKRNKHLTLADLSNDIAKAERLGSKGLADNYILMTSMHVSGETDEHIRERFLGIEGVKVFEAYGHEWISNVIRQSPRLRMLVPRVYGLGDLSCIMDERAAAQATEILSSMGEDLSKFVITDAHRQSVRALSKHGFVLLLGEPAAGKSTIAASLAISAIDNWGHTTFKIRTADEFVRHSSPHDGRQFFWVDDAFGATQLDHTAATDWNRAFPHMNAAIQRGARVLFTSRDYIYRAARDFLKESAFPLLRESQVIISVERLVKAEREQILYNHLRLGRQTREFRARVKPYLTDVAANLNFKPEIARRLSDPLFTENLGVSSKGLKEFVERPMEHLREVIRTLDAGSKSALAMIFMRGGALPSPLRLTPDELHAANLIGGDVSAIRRALNALNERLVLMVQQEGRQVWRFKHPTVGDALAANVASDAELLDIYLAGTTPERLLVEVACGRSRVEGVRVVVPQDRYGIVLEQFDNLDLSDSDSRSRFFRFLGYRCDGKFVRAYLERHPDFIDSLRVMSYLTVVPDMDVLVRLHQLKLLPDAKRLSVVNSMETLAIEIPDAGFLDERIRPLLTDAEIVRILAKVRDELLPDLSAVIDSWRDNYEHERDKDPGGYFELLSETLGTYREMLCEHPDAVSQIEAGLHEIEEVVDSMRSDLPDDDDQRWTYDEDRSSNPVGERSIFDDVDA